MLKRWQFWVGAGVSAFFLAISLRGLHLNVVWQWLKEANYWWLFPSVAVYFLAVWGRVWRWHYLLRRIKSIPLRNMWSPVVIGYMGNNIFPARAGEVLRAYVLKRKEGVSISTGLATVIVERIFDGLVMLIFVLIGLPLVPNLPNFLKQAVILASIAFTFGLLFLGFWAIFPRKIQAVYIFLISRLTPGRFHQTLIAVADNFTLGLGSLRSIKDVMMIFVTSVVIWLLETVKYTFVMFAFPFTVSFFALMLMNGLVNLATTLPSSPGYVGTFDLPGIVVLKNFGVNPELAAAYTLVLHAALWLPITLLGFYYMWKESLSWAELKEVAEDKDAYKEQRIMNNE